MSIFVFYNYSKDIVDLKLKELSSYECLLMGDSQIQRLDGNLLGYNSSNIASSGEHYFFTYSKLLMIVENNNHKPNVVILGVSIHNFAPIFNRLFNLDFPEGKSSLERYLYFIQPFNNSDFITHINQLLSFSFVKGVYSSPDFGGFFESDNSNPTTETINKAYEVYFSIKRDEDKFSVSQRTYLYKIDSLCTANNIELVIISTPYHTVYKEKIKTEYYDYYTKVLSKLNNRKHINFLPDKTNPNLMSDANHLNSKGVKYYSDIIRKEINALPHNNLYNK
jgi:hypothetical protein